MAGKTYNGRYLNTIILAPADNPATIGSGSYVTNSTSPTGAPAIFGAAGTTWAVTNLGMVKATGTSSDAIDLASVGTVVNGSSSVTTALITSVHDSVFLGGVGSVSNFGTITSTSTVVTTGSAGTFYYGAAVFLEHGGMFTNGAAGDTQALIQSVELGVYAGGINNIPIAGATATVTNLGTIQTTGTGTDAASAVSFAEGGSVNNQGLIESARSNGVSIRNAPGTVTNSGTIMSKAPPATAVGSGVYLQAGGTITNATGGRITSLGNAVSLGGTAATSAAALVTNTGTISGNVGVSINGLDTGAITIDNHGTITGTGGTAVSFGGGADTLIVELGSMLSGSVAGFVAGDEIDFAKEVGNGTKFVNGVLALTENGTAVAKIALSGSFVPAQFAVKSDGAGGTIVTVAPPPPSGLSFAVAADKGTQGDTFTVAGAGVAGDTVTLDDGATAIGTAEVGSGGTWSITTANPLGIGAHTLTATEVDGAEVHSPASQAQQLTITSATPNGVTFTGTAGTDVFTGGAGNDIFKFSTANLSATDTIVGGGGSDELLMSSAGTINAEGVSGVETYKLASGGANTLTLTNANFAGVTGNKITVKGGSGGNTIDASEVTGSSQAVLDGGAGADVLIAGQNDTMTGGAGSDLFVLTTPGTLALPDTDKITDFTHSTDKIAFSDAGFSLGLAGASSTPTALPSTLFVSNATGKFTSANQRFAYNTATGKLFYDSEGNTAGSSRQLIATLTDHPTLTASDLFYVT